MLWGQDHNGNFTDWIAESKIEGQVKVEKRDPGQAFRSWNEQDQQRKMGSAWNYFRTMDETVESGRTYMLVAYTSMKPSEAALRPDLKHQDFDDLPV